MGGDRHHPLVVAMAESLAASGVATLRTDLRHPDPVASAGALEARAAELLAEVGVERLLLVGTDHFLVGAIGRITDRAVAWLVTPR